MEVNVTERTVTVDLTGLTEKEVLTLAALCGQQPARGPAQTLYLRFAEAGFGASHTEYGRIRRDLSKGI